MQLANRDPNENCHLCGHWEFCTIEAIRGIRMVVEGVKIIYVLYLLYKSNIKTRI